MRKIMQLTIKFVRKFLDIRNGFKKLNNCGKLANFGQFWHILVLRPTTYPYDYLVRLLNKSEITDSN